MKKYYSAESAHGSDTSWGFSNDTIVKVFSSRSARDEYVRNSRNITCKAIPARMATREATNFSLSGNHTNAPRPFHSEFWAIIPPYEGADTPGLLGHLDVANSDDYIVERLF